MHLFHFMWVPPVSDLCLDCALHCYLGVKQTAVSDTKIWQQASVALQKTLACFICVSDKVQKRTCRCGKATLCWSEAFCLLVTKPSLMFVESFFPQGRLFLRFSGNVLDPHTCAYCFPPDLPETTLTSSTLPTFLWGLLMQTWCLFISQS